VHANNTYIEVLVGMGVIGATALAWLIAAASRSAMRLLRSPAATPPLVAVSAAACLAIAVHALVDSFLTFTPTYAVFAIAAGLLYAHRV
jgi:O-antigen ligase